jgi:putative heme iron utilization protein
MLLSGLARHTKNLERESHCSLLLVEPGGEQGDPLAGARLTITGTAKRIAREHSGEARNRFLDAHPSASLYVDFEDFSFFQIDVDQVHVVAGFGRIETIPASQL